MHTRKSLFQVNISTFNGKKFQMTAGEGVSFFIHYPTNIWKPTEREPM